MKKVIFASLFVLLFAACSQPGLEDLQFRDQDATLYVYHGDALYNGEVWTADRQVKMSVDGGICKQFFFYDNAKHLVCQYSMQQKTFYNTEGEVITESQFVEQYPQEANALHNRHAAVISLIEKNSKQ